MLSIGDRTAAEGGRCLQRSGGAGGIGLQRSGDRPAAEGPGG